jgi:adiponectin receptor
MKKLKHMKLNKMKFLSMLSLIFREKILHLKLSRVGSIDEAPEFLKDNEFIKNGYRINFSSICNVFKSLFILHNESVNIWSHLLGTLMVIALILYTGIVIEPNRNSPRLCKTLDTINSTDLLKQSINFDLEKWPIFVMLSCALLCLSCSATFHWFCAHSKHVHEFLNRLDYAGISILISGSCIPPYFYFFYCEMSIIYLFLEFRMIYLTSISVLAISVFIYSLNPNFTTPNRRKLRGIIFLILGICTAIPFGHLFMFR